MWWFGAGERAAWLQPCRPPGGGQTPCCSPPEPGSAAWLAPPGSSAPDGNELSPWQTGLWGAFLRELQRREPGGLDHNWVSCFGYRPATAEAVLRDWCRAEPRLRWWPSTTLAAIRRRGARIEALELCRG